MNKMLKCKIHRAIVTDADLHYEGSITIDRSLMDMAGIQPFEMVSVLNINNGERIETYAMPGETGSGEICMNGAAARRFMPGDLVIILATVWLPEEESGEHHPRIIRVDERNRPMTS
ncbi:aspartate 1-decarboxylase [bacterium]|nr:aspartate 1-decarboxylase [candidate division CSSED10-310 bacterium]